MTSPNPAPARRQVRQAAAGFLTLGGVALGFDLMSHNPDQARYVLGAIFLVALSAVTYLKAR